MRRRRVQWYMLRPTGWVARYDQYKIAAKDVRLIYSTYGWVDGTQKKIVRTPSK